MEKLYSANEAAKYLGISHIMMRKLCHDDPSLKAQLVGKAGYVIEEGTLAKYKAKREREVRSRPRPMPERKAELHSAFAALARAYDADAPAHSEKLDMALTRLRAAVVAIGT